MQYCTLVPSASSMARLLLLLLLGTLVTGLLTVTQAATIEEKKAEALQFVTECKKELQISDEAIEKFAKIRNSTEENFKCFLKCMGEKHGIIKDGRVDGEAWKERIRAVTELQGLSPEKTAERLRLVEVCKDKSGVDACDTAAEVYYCIQDIHKQNNEVMDNL